MRSRPVTQSEEGWAAAQVIHQCPARIGRAGRLLCRLRAVSTGQTRPMRAQVSRPSDVVAGHSVVGVSHGKEKASGGFHQPSDTR